MSDVEDAVQATFEQYLLADPATIREAAGWLIVVATRVCARSLRDVYRHRSVSLETCDDPTIPDPSELVVEQRSIGELLAILSLLEQEVLVLRYSRQLAYDDIARRLGLSPSNARQIAHRSRQRLRDALILIDT